MVIDIFDPTISPEKTPITYAPRPETLEGLRVGLVDNSKYNSKALLLRIADRLKARYGVELGHLVTKATAGHAVSEAAISVFKERVEVVIAGIGD